MKKVAKRQFCRSIRLPARESWYPCLIGNTVEVTLMDIGSVGQPNYWRVCVWGGDDTGMEKDFINMTNGSALATQLYEQIIDDGTVVRTRLVELGLVFA